MSHSQHSGGNDRQECLLKSTATEQLHTLIENVIFSSLLPNQRRAPVGSLAPHHKTAEFPPTQLHELSAITSTIQTGGYRLPICIIGKHFLMLQQELMATSYTFNRIDGAEL